LECASFQVRSGIKIRCWEDTWIMDKPLGVTYPSLYHIARKKDADVAHVLRTTALNISFRRALGMT
jgi:hypothetical protein